MRSVGDIVGFAKVNVNKVNICYGIVLNLVAICSFRCTLSLRFYLHSVIADQNELKEAKD